MPSLIITNSVLSHEAILLFRIITNYKSNIHIKLKDINIRGLKYSKIKFADYSHDIF